MRAEADSGESWVPSATTRPVVLLGDPVDHSLSPLLHNTAFRQLGLDLVYLALPVEAGDVACVLEALGAVGCAGANVTVPHKLAAHDACDELTGAAAATGAVNTLWWVDGRLHGDNTDVSGFGRVLERANGDGPAVVLGTGGAARAVVVALDRAGQPVTVVGRRLRAAERVAGLATSGAALDLAHEQAVTAAVEEAATVVNATPLGMGGERLPPTFHDLEPHQVVHDLVYVAGTTPFVAAAVARGATAVDGRELLAAQAEDAFERWIGRRPPGGLFATLLRDRDR